MPTKQDASQRRQLPRPPAAELDGRSRRARSEWMAITPFGTGIYEVESESGNTYLVDITAGRCTCPDHTFRGARCKHLRRVAIEITEGRVPPPGRIAVDCAVCGAETFVDVDAPEPYLCPNHEFAPGDVVRDRETGDRLLVVSVSDRRANEVDVESSNTTVAAHYSNADYPDDDPVVGVVYPQSLRMTEGGPLPDSLRVYSFPRSRLDPTPDESEADQTRLTDPVWAR